MMDSRQSYWQDLVIVMEKNEGDVYIGKRKRRDLLGGFVSSMVSPA